MNKLILAGVSMASSLAIVTGAMAQTPAPSPANPAAVGVKMSQADCQNLWKQADSAGSGSLSQSQAQLYAKDFKSVDSDADGKLSSAEWLKGCENGSIMNSGASTGAASGAGGSSTSGSSPSTMPKK